MTYQMCNCPICPLIAVNMQVYDVIIKFRDTGYHLECHTDDVVKIMGLEDHFMRLAASVRDKFKLKKGQVHSAENISDCEFHIECLRKNQFKVCFYTKSQKPYLSRD